MEHLWAPWRLEYVGSADWRPAAFSAALASDDEEGLVVHRGERAFVLLNRFPYASGHFMVAPNRHAGDLAALEPDEVVEIHRLATEGIAAWGSSSAPEGFNLGWNIGRVAGAGIVDHVHLHVVPRWAGDTNFMPVLADVKAMPEPLAETRRRLAEIWPRPRTQYRFHDPRAAGYAIWRPGVARSRGINHLGRVPVEAHAGGPGSSARWVSVRARTTTQGSLGLGLKRRCGVPAGMNRQSP